jgi:hypothetical protein
MSGVQNRARGAGSTLVPLQPAEIHPALTRSVLCGQGRYTCNSRRNLHDNGSIL